eukprot:TRINITY_DN27609_c0_g1_i1.p1 TRINITY_DN27609_c0_g1~~TRINITY_DN27609_c0_g1_i1.p1  ORF type:complete len:433 (-),score=102.89 TRINITY_DN27609_c0_g1_i1:73-1188(-)
MKSSEALDALYAKWFPRTRTNIIENDLRELGESLGVRFHYGFEVKTAQDLKDVNPDVIIASTGAKCSFRRSLVEDSKSEESNNEFRVKKDLGALLQVKFEAIGRIERNSSAFKKFLQNLPAQQSFFNILPGNYDEITQTTPVTCFAMINEEIYSQFADVSSFDGVKLSELTNLSERSTRKGSDAALREVAVMDGNQESLAVSPERNKKAQQMLTKLGKDIMKVIAPSCPNGINEESMKISALPVAYHVAKKVSGQSSEIINEADGSSITIPVFLAGDAAMGLPLEKGLNYGWHIASILCQSIRYSDDLYQAAISYDTAFSRVSEIALEHVERDYEVYKKTVAGAGVVRSLVQVASLGIAGALAPKFASILN